MINQALFANQVKARWNIHFYILDLDLTKAFFLSPKIALHPYCGLKGASITQHVRSKAHSFFPTVSNFTSKDRNDFWGIGPALGCGAKYFLTNGLNLFGSLGGAVLWGDFTIRHKDTAQVQKFDTRQLSPMAQIQLGLGYETNVYHDHYRFSFNARYEMQYWWGQNQMPMFSSFVIGRFERYAEDLSLQGVTFDVRFDF